MTEVAETSEVPTRTDGRPIRVDLVAELVELLKGEREAGMGLQELIDASESAEYEVEKVNRFDVPDGDESVPHWEVSWDGGITGIFEYDGVIEAGDKIRLYPSGRMGARRQGWALNGEIIEFATPWERLVKELQWWADRDRVQRMELDEKLDEMNAAYEALPQPLKERIDRFRDEDPNFRLESERYEMAAVGDAPKIAEALRPEIEALEIKREDDEEAWLDAVANIFDTFREQEWKDIKAKVPDLQDGHSGNTFGGAVGLGYRYACGLEL